MREELFFKDEALPFIECRYTKNSTQHYKAHMHRSLSIGAIDKEEVLYSVDGKSAKLTNGSLAIINPNTLHHCNPIEKHPRSYYMLYVDMAWVKRVQESLFEKSFLCEEILLKDDGLYQEYINTMDFFMKEKSYLLEKEQMMVSLLQKIFMKLTPQKIKKPTPLHVKELQKMLLADLSLDITLEEMAKNLGINPYTLLRNFKEKIGLTPHAYRLNCRIEKAKKLLQEGEDISFVALECGFFDQSHFHKNFKAITAVTPKEYRLNFLQ